VPFARIATIASVTVLFALAGCGHAPAAPVAEREPAATAVPLGTATESPGPSLSPAPSATATTSTRPASKKKATVDAGSGNVGLDRFVAAVQQRLPEVALDRRDEEVEDLGEQACDALGDGHSTTAAVSAISEQGVAAADARTLVGLAKKDLCRA
jgi:hypothetical protein